MAVVTAAAGPAGGGTSAAHPLGGRRPGRQRSHLQHRCSGAEQRPDRASGTPPRGTTGTICLRTTTLGSDRCEALRGSRPPQSPREDASRGGVLISRRDQDRQQPAGARPCRRPPAGEAAGARRGDPAGNREGQRQPGTAPADREADRTGGEPSAATPASPLHRMSTNTYGTFSGAHRSGGGRAHRRMAAPCAETHIPPLRYGAILYS